VTEPQYAAGQQLTSGTLYRRIYFSEAYYQDGKVTSQAFARKSDQDHLSMALSSLITPEDLVAQAGDSRFGVLAIDVADLVSEGLQVVYDPSEGEGRAHVQVRGELSRAARKRLAEKARVPIPPTVS